MNDKTLVNFIIILSLLFSILNAVASSGEFQTKNHDINKDGKTDLVEVFHKKILIERKEDIDGDGIFDVLTTFSPDKDAQYFKVIEQRALKNSPRRRVSFWNDLKAKKVFSLTQVDKNNDGNWDIEYQSASELNQKRENCEEVTTSFSTPLNLAQEVGSVTAQSPDYVETSWGHKIHKSCLENGQRDFFLNNTETAITKGLSCLERLGNLGGRGAASNHASLSNLLANKNVQVICNETGYDWGEGTIAHATSSSSRNTAQLTHPAMSVNPAMIKEYQEGGVDGQTEFVRTMFHEQLHNLGYLHGHDIEYPYACEKCCFPGSTDNSAQTTAACKVCSGNYTGSTDLNYLKDISEYGRVTFSTGNALSTNIKYLKENPSSLDGMSYLALNLSGVFDPVGLQLALKLKDKEKLSAEQSAVITRALTHKDSALLKTYEPGSKIIADAFYASYKERDPGAALDLLRTNISVIRNQLNLADTQEHSQFVRDSMKDGLKKLIFDIWLDKYSGNSNDPAVKDELGMKAYRLTTDLGL